MIKAIIFDCFGVLVTSSYEPFKAQYLQNDPDLIKKFMQVENRSSRGEISLEQAEIEFAEIAGVSFQETSSFLQDNPRNVLLLRYIHQELKGRYKIAMLSNIADDRIHELFIENDIELFDDMVLSYQVGLAKPDRQIYELAAERLMLKPEECVFVDDNSYYCDGARHAGMSTVLYDNFKQMKSELEKLLKMGDTDK
jgi:epoxide hydrolase-like predicted phosphatase